MKRTVLIMLSLLCLTGTAARAQGIQPSIQALNEQIARAEEEIRRNEALLSKIKGERAVTQNELKLIISRITNRQQIVSSLDRQIDLCERDIAAKNKEITETNRRIEVLKNEYADMIYAAYKNYLLNNSLAFLFASRDFQEATLRINYMKRYNRMREAKAAELDSLSGVLRNEVRKLDEQRAQLEASRASRDKELRTLRADEQTYKQNSSRLAADERKIADRIRRKEREKQNAQKQLQRLVAEEARRNAGTKRTAAEEQVRVELSNNFEQNAGKFPYPVSGGVIIDRFGKHPHPTQRGLTIDNKGVNIAGEKGAPVRCIFEGTVSRVVFIKGLNNCVMVNHGNYYTVYSNLESVDVKANDRVGRNEVIGRLSSTENSDDWYLHFELWKGTTFLNPEKWLSR
ncbi:MAG TPA: peptidoglycan DD-metalloendopeptidase family protein [Candidatus Tidjanibacter gallistercoris]|nr:peptidoglycan DD-metalloendopeptidase family protein [Candidatus Tidjanibacter gallistercoris]